MKLANILRTASVLLTAALPLSVSAAITQFTFVNGMTGANEVPARISSGGVTINTLSFDDTIGSFGTLTVNLSYFGLSGASNNAHIHAGAAGVNGGVIQGLTHSSATSGTITGSYAPADLVAQQNLFNSLTYINLHSTVFGGGELRGQLTPVPEPSAYGLIAGAFILGVVTIRRRNVRSA